MKKLMLIITAMCSISLAGCGQNPNPKPAEPISISLNETDVTMAVGSTKQLIATVLPENATDKTVTWSVSDGSDFISVSNDGLVTAIKEGNATVEAKTVNNIKATCLIKVNKNIILPTGITLNETNVTLDIGETKQLVATVSPSNATDKTVRWSVTKGSDVVSVSENGLVTAIKEGSATVEAMTVNNIASTCSFTVTKQEVLPSKVSLDKTELSLVVGQTAQLNAVIEPDDAIDKTVTWAVTTGTSYVSVSQSGLVTAIAKGSSIVTVSTVNGKTATCLIKVSENVVNPTGVTLNETDIGIVVGSTKQLIATVLPNDATDKSVIWEVIEGSSYISVDDTGLVSGKSVGTGKVQVSTINGKTAVCNVTVTPVIIEPTSISISGDTVLLEVSQTATLTATVLPENATDKTVTWEISEGNDVASVDANGVVTALKVGRAIVTAKTVNDLEASLPVVVKNKSIKGYITDKMGLISGNPYEKVGDGDWEEVDNKQEMEDTIIYTFTYGASVKFKLQTVGYMVPTGLDVNGYNHSCDDNQEVRFNAVVDDPDSPLLYSLDIEVKYKNVTPKTGEYEFVVSESTHISLTFYDETKSVIINSADQNDICYIVPEFTDEDYGVKSLIGYSYTTDDTIQHKNYFDITKQADGSYKFTCPYSSQGSKKIFFEVTEINLSKFKDHEIVGNYAVIRTYGLSEGSLYVDNFENDVVLSFDASGMITYKDEVAYALDAKDGVVSATFSTSSFNGYYGKNVLVLGQSGSGQNMITPFTQDSNDIVVGVKMVPGMLISDIVIDNFVFKIGSDLYAVFSFYYNNELYASLFADVTNKSVITDVSIIQYLGEKLALDKTVFEVFDKNDTSMIHVGYTNEGGKGNYYKITTRENGFHNNEHTLVFINDSTAIYDTYVCKVTGDDSEIMLDAPTRHIEITLNTTDYSFVVTEEHEVVPKTLDIANKTFTGKSGGGNSLSVVFGPSNDEITGKVIEVDGCGYFWEFTAEFDSSNNQLIIQVINVGYFYTYRPEVTYPYSDAGALKGTRRIAIEDGKLTFIDNISGMTSYWITKNCTVTCPDFHF